MKLHELVCEFYANDMQIGWLAEWLMHESVKLASVRTSGVRVPHHPLPE